ncbi:MAG: HesA/MoeB/ThiF family protein [Proteobacteria bacterium]|nr:HesA/MoeB/ThiF family protein [Pseudomonadota bacterium]MDA0851938.1 HesA/MoeB/ThiF family protein [Pseudomonadota bacterium]MDA1295938.1 HesA/MoeB/ThiF family protein [Pseudomonadota bacterium]
MLLFLGAALVFYAVTGRLGVARHKRLTVLGVAYVLVLGLQLILPLGHPLRQATGGSAAPWAILGGMAVLVFLYRLALNALRAKADQKDATAEAPKSDGLRREELERYARHIVLREIGGTGQMAFKKAKVLVIGAGGLGSPALQYLAAAGVGTIGVIDDDVVENANLQRQIIHSDQAIGMAKVFSAQSAMLAQNPYIEVKPYHRRLDKDIAEDLFDDYDIILEGSDNFETRYLANQTAHKLGRPLVSGALSQWEGQIAVFDPASGGPCYQCIFPEAPASGLAPSCAEAGVFAPLPGVVGSMMAVETLKVIARSGDVLRNHMLLYDALYGETRKIALQKRNDCPICGNSE